MATEHEIPNSPKVTVLMPVYNGERYLKEAVDSILAQTFTDLEFLIIVDPSTDRTLEILRGYGDPRIRIVANEDNLGLVGSLNKGLAMARGEYIARMDADDISLPERLKIQVEFMEHNPQVCVCGSWVKIIGSGDRLVWTYPIDSYEIQCRLLFNCPLAHPTVIYKKDFLVQNNLLYDSTFNCAEDYDLWVRISILFPIVNIGKVLLKHRVHQGSICQNYSSVQIHCADQLHYRQLQEFLGLMPTKDELRLHSSISSGAAFETRKDYLNDVEEWLLKILTANQERKYFDNVALSAELAKRWYVASNKAANLGLNTWKKFRESPLSDGYLFTYNEECVLFLKCLLKIRAKLERLFIDY